MTVRVALTETINAFADMPANSEDLPNLAGHLEDIRRANISHNLELIEEAAQRGAMIVGLGELFSAPYFALHRDPMWRVLAEDATSGPTATAICTAAQEFGLIIVAPIYEHDASNAQRFNTTLIISESGQILGKHRKVHIPEGSNEEALFDERFYYQESDGDQNQNGSSLISTNPWFPVFRTSLARIGIAACYDRHFEGTVSTLAAGGAELILAPSITFGAKSMRLWELEFPVDAARHNVFIGGSNRRGSEPPWNQEFFGGSYFAGPNGRIDNISDHDNLIIADIDLDSLNQEDPSGWNLLRDRRPEVYGDADSKGPEA